MATAKTDAQRVAEYRKQAQDKSLPQEVRDQADMKANEIEAKSVDRAGVKLAKGGVVAKAPAKKAPMKEAAKQPMKKAGVAIVIAPMKKMAKGGAVKKKC